MILIVTTDPAFAQRVGGLLEAQGPARTVERATMVERALGDRPTAGTVVVFGPDVPTGEALDAGARLRQAHPTLGLVVVTSDDSTTVLRTALRAGITDVVPADASDSDIVEAALHGLDSSRRLRDAIVEEEDEVGRRVVSVFSTKGGSGKSTVASNLSVLLAQEHPGEVALVDLDLQSGDIAVMLQLLPSWTIHDAAVKGETLDEEELRGYLTDHRSGLKVLAAPTHPSEAEAIGGEATAYILTLMQQMFRYVVIDCPPMFTEPVLAALDVSDQTIVIAGMDVPSIKDLRMAVNTLEELGHPRDQLRLVLNRADSKVGLTLREVEKSLGTTIDTSLPSSREVPFSVNQGVPLVMDRPKSPVARALTELLTVFRDEPAEDNNGGRRSRRRG